MLNFIKAEQILKELKAKRESPIKNQNFDEFDDDSQDIYQQLDDIKELNPKDRDQNSTDLVKYSINMIRSLLKPTLPGVMMNIAECYI
mmetsp:Transcript_31371/g.28562  ORF Transcript_31371/g.28562 Transcript_31371/m.28562 type:complete len:88 (-) Transcript_31371:304-567(-)|eukprot:CAMPEP_0114584780 /NCGR_PEP_ID=MMETSP0125-20121206/8419_1 /TAXON_ID=485358 ORGANISM="Aristerostoma sp., Strain ATCC 50986" /NCGR_SAMPLE_ID=MMETSP0125 /ASSEMBLY_ACC=CAM_ASM_000245 /LENGTH=87 /DNA_ID=CAMNT_0001779391 /DNA_START=1032 /DNA_END=1295 /DNA_ORIENTATION=+